VQVPDGDEDVSARPHWVARRVPAQPAWQHVVTQCPTLGAQRGGAGSDSWPGRGVAASRRACGPFFELGCCSRWALAPPYEDGWLRVEAQRLGQHRPQVGQLRDVLQGWGARGAAGVQ
jgi:hypothetical protein